MGFGFMSLCVPIFHPLFSPWTWPLLHPCLDYCRWCCSKLDSSPAGWGLWGHRGRSSSRHSFAQKDSKFSLFNGGSLAAKLCLTLATPWTVVYQASLSGFSSQEYWSGLPSPSPGDHPDPGVQLKSPALKAGSLLLSHQGSPASSMAKSNFIFQDFFSM